MSQVTPDRVTGQVWTFLEPVQNPNYARTDHGRLKPAGAGLTLTYPKGQIVLQNDDGTNEWAKIGTAGYNGAPRIIKYSITVNENGVGQLGQTWFANAFGADLIQPGSWDFYYQGDFACEDLVGLAGTGGVNEVQTETVTATGGTRRLNFNGYHTGDLAFNASAATIQAAMEALPSIGSGNITVTGTGPFVYTFIGTLAGKNIPAISITTTSLTGGSSTMAQTTGGSDAINEVQTETVTATGGTRTITVINPNTGDSQTTAAIAFNANAAAIQAALELLSNVAAGDIVVSGTGPFVYTMSGNFAGKDVAPLVVNTGSLTGGSSSFAQTTGGASARLARVGQLIRGTVAFGILRLGVPALG